MSPAFHVQIIEAHWTKRARGGEFAAFRNQVPLMLPVEANQLQRGFLSVRIFRFGESDFSKPSLKCQRFELNDKLHFEHGAFSLDWNQGEATTGWHWSVWNVGAPEPKVFDPKVGQFQVAPDEWVRARWRGRFSWQDGPWTYAHTVVNVARCDAKLGADFSTSPSRLFERLPHLR
jgi:hypothetical protein